MTIFMFKALVTKAKKNIGEITIFRRHLGFQVIKKWTPQSFLSRQDD